MRLKKSVIAIAVLLLVFFAFSAFGCGTAKIGDTDPDTNTEPDSFTVTLHNVTSEDFTAWADGTKGDKIVKVKIGETITIPQMKYNTMTVAEIDNRNNDFDGWYYSDKDGKEVKLDVTKEFTLENLNVDKYEITVYANLRATSLGPF